jgi:hypothetical protein
MNENFIQKKIDLNQHNSIGKLKVEKLCELIKEHPYKESLYKAFHVDSIKEEYINIDNIDTIFERIKVINNNYDRFNIIAQIKDVNVFQEERLDDENADNDVCFQFDEYVEIDEVKSNLKSIAIYNSKNSFFDEYDMSKFANSLLKKKHSALSSLVSYNVNFFKELAKSQKEFNKYKSYRLVKYDGDIFLRGITSEKYNEYGVDFAFVVSMLIFHNSMKKNEGINYEIKDCSLNESKLDMIVTEKHSKDAGSFGKVSTAIKVSTNDLGQGSLNFSNIINVNVTLDNGIFLYPKTTRVDKRKLIISHTTSPEKVFNILNEMDDILHTSDEFINDLKETKTINTPDELRVKILVKIESPRSSLKQIKNLSDIFKRKIDNEISSFQKLLEMCNKAEELNIEFDLKDKLRYIISDIVLYGKQR